MCGFRRFALVLTAIAGVGLIAILLGRQLIHDHIRSALEAKLNEHYASQGVRVEIGAARFREGEGVDISGIRFISLEPKGAREVMVTIDRVLLVSDATLMDLVNDRVDIERVEVDGVRAYAHRGTDNQWNLAALFPPPQMSDQPAPIRLIRGQLILDSRTPGQELRIALDNVRLSTAWHFDETSESITPGGLSADSTDVSSVQSLDGRVINVPTTKVASSKQMKPRWMSLYLSFEADRLVQANIKGLLDLEKGQWRLTIQGQGLDLDEKYLQFVPDSIKHEIAPLRALHGQVDLEGYVAGDSAFSEVPRFQFKGTVRDGHLHDDRIPYPLEGVTAAFSVDQNGFQLSDLGANLGSSRLTLSSHGGWPISGEMPLKISATGKSVRLDETVIKSLPESIQKIWFTYEPRGLADLDVNLTFDGTRWVPEAHISLLDVSFLPRAFPYRIDNCVGEIHATEAECRVDFRGYASGREVSVNGAVYKDFAKPTEVVIRLSDPVPIDEKLMAAMYLNPGLQKTLREFDPSGVMSCEATLRRSPENGKVALDTLRIDVADGSIEYERIPYPIRAIQGVIRYENKKVILDRLVGENDGGGIILNGTVGQQGSMDLHIMGRSIPMEDELREALPIGLQKIWLNINPRGIVDHVTIRATRDSVDTETKYEVHASQFKNSNGVGRSLSIQPVWFPYRMHDLTGSLSFNDGQVTIRELEAYAGGALVATEGRGHVDHLGWITRFDNLSVDGLVVDETFLLAMPKGLSDALRRLQPEGPINLFGGLTLSALHERANGQTVPRSSENSLVVEWDVHIDMDNGSLYLGRPVENIFGGLQLIGRQDAMGTHQVGYVNCDSMMIAGVQVTNVRGPLRIGPEAVTFGRWADYAENGRPPQPLVANAFGGTISVDASVALDDRNSFSTQSYLENADLTQLARQLAPQMTGMSGEAHALLKLSGNSTGKSSYVGDGFVRLRNATIYEFPLMLSMLKVLSTKPPDSTAFTTSNIDFQIIDEHVYFDRIEFIGDAISLKGNGDMDFGGQLDLSFYSVVGRDELKIPVITPLFGAASQNFLLIEIDGTVEQPQVRQTPFPALNETLQQLFPESPVDQVSPVIPGIPSISESLNPSRRRGPR